MAYNLYDMIKIHHSTAKDHQLKIPHVRNNCWKSLFALASTPDCVSAGQRYDITHVPPDMNWGCLLCLVTVTHSSMPHYTAATATGLLGWYW